MLDGIKARRFQILRAACSPLVTPDCWRTPRELCLSRHISLPDSSGSNKTSFKQDQPQRHVHPNALAERDAGTLREKAPLDLAQDAQSVSGIVDAILDVGRQRNALLAQLRAALESGANRDALTLARRLCGLP